MYSTCLFCTSDLGRNEAIESFPIGRRLVFDGAKGRLWVVCRRCERWNLTPLEQRWEAIESCERAFRATTLRTSTDEIGLARLREGTELVRVGAPLRPEMAAWRYGDQFGRRTRRNVLLGVGSTAAMAAVVWGGPALGLYSIGGVSALNLAVQGGMQWMHRRRPIAHVRMGEGDAAARLTLAKVHVVRARLHPDGLQGWSLEVPFLSADERLTYTMQGLRHLTKSVTLTGDEARRAAAQILPHLNTVVRRASMVQDAVRVLEDAGPPGMAFWQAARTKPVSQWNGGMPEAGRLYGLPVAMRLALEMAAHEESERRALEDELHLLHAAWRDAEEIASIADDLLVPPAVEAHLARLKGR